MYASSQIDIKSRNYRFDDRETIITFEAPSWGIGKAIKLMNDSNEGHSSGGWQ